MGYVMTIEENGKEYCILTEKGTELYKVISTQETAVSTQETQKSTQEILGKGIEDILEILGKRANKLGKRLGKNRIAIIKLVYKDPTVSSVEMAEYIGIYYCPLNHNPHSPTS